MTDSGWAQLVLFLTTVAGFGYQAWREQRSREWSAGDRAAATANIIATAQANAEALLIKTQAEAEALRIIQGQTTRLITSKLDTVHQVAVEAKAEAQVAYSEANGLNLKNHELRQEILAVANGGKTAQRLDHLQGTADDIQTSVGHIEDAMDVRKVEGV
jgi:hypothetical protein